MKQTHDKRSVRTTRTRVSGSALRGPRSATSRPGKGSRSCFSMATQPGLISGVTSFRISVISAVALRLISSAWANPALHPPVHTALRITQPVSTPGSTNSVSAAMLCSSCMIGARHSASIERHATLSKSVALPIWRPSCSRVAGPIFRTAVIGYSRSCAPGRRERMIFEENFFVETVLPKSIVRRLSDEEFAMYRKPFVAATRAGRRSSGRANCRLRASHPTWSRLWSIMRSGWPGPLFQSFSSTRSPAL